MLSTELFLYLETVGKSTKSPLKDNIDHHDSSGTVKPKIIHTCVFRVVVLFFYLLCIFCLETTIKVWNGYAKILI